MAIHFQAVRTRPPRKLSDKCLTALLSRPRISDNYGTYDLPMKSYNNAVYCSVQKLVPQAWNLSFGVAVGADWGSQFGNSFGAMVIVARSGIIWKSKR